MAGPWKAPRVLSVAQAKTRGSLQRSNRVFDACEAIIDAAFEAWQKAIARLETISSL